MPPGWVPFPTTDHDLIGPCWDTSGIRILWVNPFPGLALILFAYPALPAVIPAGMGIAQKPCGMVGLLQMPEASQRVAGD